jgi:hypothetical protein
MSMLICTVMVELYQAPAGRQNFLWCDSPSTPP